MTVDITGVDFVLEKMMQLLINSDDDPLILEAYEEKVIDKDQIQSLYEDMQFLGKFLKDWEHDEQLKQLVSKIRDVTCQVGNITDLQVLNSALQKHKRVFAADELCVVISLSWKMVDLSKKIFHAFKTITKDTEFVKDFRTKVINLLSSFESQLADHDRIGDSFCFSIDIIKDIKRTKIDVMQIYENEIFEIRDGTQSEMRIKRLIITWLQSDMPPHEFLSLFKFSEKMIYRSKRIRHFLQRETQPIIKSMMLISAKQLSPTRIADHIQLLLSLSQEMTDLVKGFSFVFYSTKVVIQSIKEKVVRIYDKASSVASLHESHMADEFLWGFNFLELKFVHSLHDPRCVIHGIDSSKTEMIYIYERELNLTWLDCSKIRCGFGSVTEVIKSIKTEVKEIYEKKKLYGIRGGGVLQFGKSSQGTYSPKPISPIVEEETVVGLDEETRTIKELLTEEHEKQLKFISIIGMPGLGKTTLATKVYNDSLIQYHFYIRAWIYVSQAYQKRDLLLAIFSSAFSSRDDICNLSDQKLGEGLYKRLKGNRYLIIMDDIWNTEPWNDLKIYFPNDNNGSRILFTTRHEDVAVALHAKSHHLRFLNEDESWDLLRLKTFRKESCPLELMEIGKKQIARKCRGLPLAIVVISGLLAKQDNTLAWWKQVAESVSSYMVSDPEHYMHILELSYNVLPHYLKACFLYFGAFTEDSEIPVQKLIWLWVAEGFIGKNEQKTLEDVAYDYLMDLIDRSLVIVSKKRSNGEIKACYVHDLLRDLCLRKAQEENFLDQISIKGHQDNLLEENAFQHFGSSSSSTIFNKHRSMCIHPDLANFTSLKHCPFSSKVCSILSFGRSNSWGKLRVKNVSFIHKNFILLRVLDLSSIQIAVFPERITQLVLLSYLALHVVAQQEIFLPLKSNLLNLETLILEGSVGSLVLSHDMGKIVKLRHLKAQRHIEFSRILNNGCVSLLRNLQTVGKLHFYSGEERALKGIPSLRKLKCFISKGLNGDDHFPKLGFLIHLETLNVLTCDCKRFFHRNNFPASLKSLTLSYVSLSWEEMSTLGMLPNLEVLKLLYQAFKGPRWDTCDGEFRKLRFLKFQGLDISQWNASSNHFPYLQQLVLEECARLEEIPSSLGDISTLEMIQLRCCSRSVENSARKIQEDQRSMGNDWLKIQIFSHRWNPEMVISEDFAT